MQKFGDIFGGIFQLMHYATPPEGDWVVGRLKIFVSARECQKEGKASVFPYAFFFFPLFLSWSLAFS
jgi:hypothetical protein